MSGSNQKILLVTNRVPYPLKDGGALAMQSMINGYLDAGCQVGLLTMNTSRHPVAEDKLPLVFQQLSFLQAVPVENEISLRKIARNFIFSRQPEHASRFYNVNFEAELISALRKFEPDVVQFESVFLSTYLPSVRAFPTVKIVLRLHNVEHQIWQRLSEETKNPFKKAYLSNLGARIKRYEEEWWPTYDLLLPISENDAQSIRDVLPNLPMCVAQFGIKPVMAEPNKIPEEWCGYHIGAMDWLPNQEAVRWFVKEVWPQLREDLPQFSFHYAGRNMPDEFFNYGTLGVHCAGEVDDAQTFIADKKILIVPLRSGGGIRVKTLEAMAAGKLVVSTAAGMLGISVEDKVHYLQANTKQEFIEAIIWAFENKAAVEQISLAGKTLVHSTYNSTLIMQRVLAAIAVVKPHSYVPAIKL